MHLNHVKVVQFLICMFIIIFLNKEFHLFFLRVIYLFLRVIHINLIYFLKRDLNDGCMLKLNQIYFRDL
jgi:hypothetical protein